MAIENYPEICPATASWRRISSTQTFQSPFSNATQTVGMSGSLWSASLVYPIMVQADYDVLNAFIIGLRGRAGRFYLSPPQYQPEIAHPTGLTATVSGTTVTLSGAAVNLNVGSYLSINYELKMVITKTSDTVFTVDQPFLQVYTAAAIELNDPQCMMMMADDNYQMEFAPPLLQAVTIDCIEAISV